MFGIRDSKSSLAERKLESATLKLNRCDVNKMPSCGALPPPRTPRPESLILMILSDNLIRGASFTLLQGFSNLDLDSSPSETERLSLVLQIWTSPFCLVHVLRSEELRYH